MGKDRGAIIDLDEAIDAGTLAAGLKVEHPRFAGTTDDGDPFVVTARSALPDKAVPDRVELEEPNGELRLSNGVTLNVEATEGQMHRKDERLELTGGVTLKTSDGYEARTARVELDLDTKTAVAPGSVEASGPLGSIRADRLAVERASPETREVTIRFEGNVRVIYKGGKAD